MKALSVKKPSFVYTVTAMVFGQTAHAQYAHLLDWLHENCTQELEIIGYSQRFNDTDQYSFKPVKIKKLMVLSISRLVDKGVQVRP